MLYKSLQIEVKADADKRVIEGYASTFGNIDQYGDIVHPGAFTKTLRERLPKNLIKVRFQHRDPIGLPVHAEEDSKGLFTVSKISATPLGDTVLQLARDGVVDRMSIGYGVVKWEDEEQDGRRITHLKELKLYEYSLTDLPVNEEAIVTTVKSMTDLEQIFGSLDSALAYLKHQGAITDTDKAAAWITTLRKAADDMQALLPSPEPAPATPKGNEPPTDQTEPDDIALLHSAILNARLTIGRHNLMRV